MRACALLTLLLLFAAPSAQAAPRLVLWAWERPEDLRFLSGRQAEVAVQTGFVVLSGEGVFARGRRFPLIMDGEPAIHLVHVQIDHRLPLAWTPRQRAQAAAAVLNLGRLQGAQRLQVDFEVRRSERGVLLDLLADVRRGLPPDVGLSMTALASWCQTETWLDKAPVDEIVPMLFRMGPRGGEIRARLAQGLDFAEPRCRAALAVSVDTPLRRAPIDRRIYLFDPKSWTPQAFAAVNGDIDQWSSPAP